MSPHTHKEVRVCHKHPVVSNKARDIKYMLKIFIPSGAEQFQKVKKKKLLYFNEDIKGEVTDIVGNDAGI